MGEALRRLLDVLDLEEIDRNIFRGQNEPNRYGRLFGGQVAAQALVAASRTVEGRFPHSLHGYFLRGGDPAAPVVFSVDRIRDGSSFATRRVVAVQHGRPIFNMSVSYHLVEEGYEHQDEMPEVTPPEEMRSWEERAREAGDRIPKPLRRWMLAERPIELRSNEPHSWFSSEPARGPNAVWLRANGEVADDPILHACLLTYASDMGFVDNIYRPHRHPGPRDVMMASLDHAVWFHRPLRIDDWILYLQESPSASGARGYVRGTMFDRSGRLVASTAQEGLMRVVGPDDLRRAYALEPQR
jgi:acyl-CoA thioesterase-2